MPLFMDRHEAPGVTAEELAAAHAADVGVQQGYDVRYLTYWFDKEAGSVFCLAEGPNRDAVEAVHRESHGLLASNIIEVEAGPVGAFLGSIPAHPVGHPYEDSAVRAVVFTDICGSTALTQELGDAASMALVREHDALVRSALEVHEGSEVKHMGDGIMASFRSVSSAVRCSIEVQDLLATRNATAATPFDLRIGISAGEPVTEDGDLFGAAVQLAARLCSTCPPGGVTVSLAVRELCMGKGLRFSDGRAAEMKGFAEVTHVYDVTWR